MLFQVFRESDPTPSSPSTNSDNATSTVLTHGLTILEDDLIVFWCSSDGSASNVTMPTNDGTIQSTDYAASETLISTRKKASDSEPSTYTFSFSTGERAQVGITVYRGVNTTTAIDSSNENSTGTDGTSATFTSLTPTENNCAVICLVGTEEGGKNFSSWPTTIVERNDNVNGPPGTGSASASGGYGDVIQTTAAAVSGTVTISSATSWATHVIALAPQVGPVITDVDTDEIIFDGQQNVTITGTDFSASGNTVFISNNATKGSGTEVQLPIEKLNV